jgi:hypothetical protein
MRERFILWEQFRNYDFYILVYENLSKEIIKIY